MSGSDSDGLNTRVRRIFGSFPSVTKAGSNLIAALALGPPAIGTSQLLNWGGGRGRWGDGAMGR